MKTNIQKAAAAMGRKGGSMTSESKAAAARANGKKGGRPRKPASGIVRESNPVCGELKK